MIEISNESLAKVLNLWTGTEEWSVTGRNKDEEDWWLYWDGMCQRRADGSTVLPCGIDKAAHNLVNFMLKERKYPEKGCKVFYPAGRGGHERYVEWVKDWEERFGGMSQEELCIPPSEQSVDHSIPVRYDHLISTEELVKRAQERWPEDGWYMKSNKIHRNTAVYYCSKGQVTEWFDLQCEVTAKFRTHLLAIIDEVRSERTTPEILDELEECRKELCVPSSTKAERFYAFLTTPQPDISPGLWGLEREPEAPVRGGNDLGWAREDVGGLIHEGGHTDGDSLGKVCETKLTYD